MKSWIVPLFTFHALLIEFSASLWAVDDSAFWPLVEAAVQRRRSEAATVEYHVTGILTEPYTLDSADSSEPDTSQLPMVREGTYRHLLDFSGRRFRMEERVSAASGDGSIPSFSIRVFDGIVSKVMRPERFGEREQARLADAHELDQIATWIPLFWSHGVYLAGSFRDGKVTDLGGSGWKWTKNGQRLTATGLTQATERSMTFDESLDYNVVECSIGPRQSRAPSGTGRDRPPTDAMVYSATYEIENGRPLLRSWRFEGLGYQKVFRVVKYLTPSGVDIREFSVPDDYLHPGDLVSKDQKPHRVSLEGNLVPWTPGAPLNKRNWSPYWTVIVTVAAAACLWRFLARRAAQ